jgi:hypothetical protein
MDRILNHGLQQDKTAYAALVYFVYCQPATPEYRFRDDPLTIAPWKNQRYSEVPNGLNFCPECRGQSKNGE